MKKPASIEISEKAQKLKLTGIDIIDLSVGQPDFSAPITINTLTHVLESKNHSGYSSSYGTQELRSLIAEHVSQKQDIPIKVNKVIVTPGAKIGLLYIINAICNKNDELIIPEPCWLSYTELCEYAGVVVQTVPSTKENRFIPLLNDILQVITPKTKAVLINNPINPSGVCWPKSLIKILLLELRKQNIYLILDAIYDDYDFYQKIETLAYYCPNKQLNNLIYVHGFSKSFSLTGHRLGYIIAEESIIEKVATIQSNLMTCPSTFSQRIAEQLLIEDQSQNIIIRMQEYRKRAQFMAKRLSQLNIPFVEPDGAFYILVDTRNLSNSSIEASTILLEQYHLATVPGIAYGQSTEGYIRLSLTQPIRVLSVAIDLLTQALKKIN